MAEPEDYYSDDSFDDPKYDYENYHGIPTPASSTNIHVHVVATNSTQFHQKISSSNGTFPNQPHVDSESEDDVYQEPDPSLIIPPRMNQEGPQGQQGSQGPRIPPSFGGVQGSQGLQNPGRQGRPGAPRTFPLPGTSRTVPSPPRSDFQQPTSQIPYDGYVQVPKPPPPPSRDHPGAPSQDPWGSQSRDVPGQSEFHSSGSDQWRIEDMEKEVDSLYGAMRGIPFQDSNQSQEQCRDSQYANLPPDDLASEIDAVYVPESLFPPRLDQSGSFLDQGHAANGRPFPNNQSSVSNQRGAPAPASHVKILHSKQHLRPAKSSIGATQSYPCPSPKRVQATRTQSNQSNNSWQDRTPPGMQSNTSNAPPRSGLKPPDKALPRPPGPSPSVEAGIRTPEVWVGGPGLFRNEKKTAGNNSKRNSDNSNSSSSTSSSSAASSSSTSQLRGREPPPATPPKKSPPVLPTTSSLSRPNLIGSGASGTRGPIREEDEEEDRLYAFRWYRGGMTRLEAEDSIKQCRRNGAFVVRKRTEADMQPYAICILYESEAYNIHIRRRFLDQKYALGMEKIDELKFDTIEDLIKFYSNNSLKLYSGGRSKGEVLLDMRS